MITSFRSFLGEEEEVKEGPRVEEEVEEREEGVEEAPVGDHGLEHAHEDVGGEGALVRLVQQDHLQQGCTTPVQPRGDFSSMIICILG